MSLTGDMFIGVLLAAAAGVLIVVLSLMPGRDSEVVPTPPPEVQALRVCADPNNLPFSNKRLEGFENRIADLIADELNMPLEYYWWAQHRGFIRNTLRAGHCDVIIGIATAVDLLLTTAPYYRSSWMFVTRSDRNLPIRSFDSPLLRQLRIGVHLVGDDGANTPPVHALNRRQMNANLAGFRLTGDYREESPPARLLDAVVDGEVDVAVAWGPLAGYFARNSSVPLNLTPVSPQIDLPFLPMVYDISIGVRREDLGLRNRLEEVLERRHSDIEKILDSYGVPRLSEEGLL